MVPGRIPCDATVYKQMDPSKSLTEYASLIQDSFKLNKDKKVNPQKQKQKTESYFLHIPVLAFIQHWLYKTLGPQHVYNPEDVLFTLVSGTEGFKMCILNTALSKEHFM